jgi:hypothetical protein
VNNDNGPANLRMFVWMTVIAFVVAILVYLGLCNHA